MAKTGARLAYLYVDAHDSPDAELTAMADRIAALMATHLPAMAMAIALREFAGTKPDSGPVYIDQKRSGLTPRQWQLRIGDGRLKAWKVGRKYMTTAAYLRDCIEAHPVRRSPVAALPANGSFSVEHVLDEWRRDRAS